MYKSFAKYFYVYVPCECLVHSRSEDRSDLKLQMHMSHHLDSWNQNQLPCKSNNCLYILWAISPALSTYLVAYMANHGCWDTLFHGWRNSKVYCFVLTFVCTFKHIICDLAFSQILCAVPPLSYLNIPLLLRLPTLLSLHNICPLEYLSSN